MAGDAARQRRVSATTSFDLVGAILRRVRVEREMLGVLIGIVLVSSFVFAAVPRLFNQMSDDGLAHAVRIASPFQRNILMSRDERIPPATPDWFTSIDHEGEVFQQGLTPAIQSIIERRTFTVDTVRYRVVDLQGTSVFPFPRYITLRYQSEVDPHIRLVAGRMPETTTEMFESPVDVTGMPVPTDVNVYEIAISPETARQLGLNVGDRVLMEPFSDDQLVRMVPRRQQSFIAVDIVGLFDVLDVHDEFWLGDPQIHRAVEYDDGTDVHIYATGLMAPDAYPQLFNASDFAFRYGWRYFVDPAALDAGILSELSADIRRLDADYGMSTFARPGETAVRTGLSSVFRRYESQRNLTETILSLSSIGLVAVSLAVIGLVSVLLADQRRAATALLRSRGGSPPQILASQLAEGLLYSVPAALLGYLLASVLTSGRATMISVGAALGFAVATTFLLTMTAARHARRSLGTLERSQVPEQRRSGRRVILEVLVIVLACLGVYLLRRRGLSGASSVARLNEFDPYLAAVPVLMGLATGLVVLRAYPIPMRVFSWVAALRRDLVPVLAFRRVARQPSTTGLPLLVLLLSVAVGVFTSVLLHTIAEGQIDTSWQRVGADYRVDPTGAGALYRGVDLSGINEIEAIAPAILAREAVLVSQGPSFGTVELLGPDVQALTEVNRDTRAAPNFPLALLEPAAPDAGQPTSPIPAIISLDLAGRSLRDGDTFVLSVMSREMTFIVVERRERFPGMPVDRPFVIASLDHLQATNPARPFRTSVLFLRAPEHAHDRIATLLAEQSQAAILVSRAREYAAIHDSPLIAGVERGYRIGLVVTGLYAALAVLTALTVTARERSRDLAYLRTLGLSRDQALGLTATELVPPVALALAAGVGLGIAVAVLIEPGIDLTAFTGPGVPVGLRINWIAVMSLVVGLTLVVAGAIGATTAIMQRVSVGQVLRVGDQ